MDGELTHTLTKLEFGAVLEIISRQAASERGANRINCMKPLSSREEADRRQKEIMEQVDFRNEGGEKIPLAGWQDTGSLLEGIVSEGAVLDCEKLVRIAEGETKAAQVKRFIDNNRDLLPLASDQTGGMSVSRELAGRVLSIIDKDYQVVDNASSSLAQLRSRIRRKRSALRRRFAEFVENPGGGKGEEFVTVRGGRYVVAVQRGGGRGFKGIVHHASGSGASVFIEPLELIEDNNEMESLIQNERKEVHRILRDITRAVYENRKDMIHNQDVLSRLDLINASASFALDFNCCIPDHSRDGRMVLKDARHPLLEMELRLKNRIDELVGLDIDCGSKLRVVVISGPNAGGKSVSLKTIGLMLLMDQSGLPIPAAPGTIIPFSGRVLVDIGDDQSIKKSLSTFSSRIVRIKKILSAAGPDSVILIDEIGDGTSNEEGEVIAEAVLERLAGISGKIFVTTHFTSLKGWAYETESAENATLEFDSDRLEPLYRMKLGVPGRSWGIETAERLGIGKDLMRKARSKLESGSRDLEGLLASLEKKRSRLENQLREARREKEEMSELAGDYRERISEFERNRKKMEKEAKQEALQIISGAGAEIEKLVSSIRASRASTESIKKAREEIRKRKKRLEKDVMEQEKSEKYDILRNVKQGDRVRVASLNKAGNVISVDSSDRIFVELDGGIKVETDMNNLTSAPRKRRGKSRRVSWSASVSETIKPEIMVRGMVRVDALEKIDRYIDKAVLQGLDTVRIIHGVGEGILRDAVYRKLRNDPRIADIHPGVPAAGGDGVAVVKLK